jgi:iron complex outermembrane receptor protein
MIKEPHPGPSPDPAGSRQRARRGRALPCVALSACCVVASGAWAQSDVPDLPTQLPKNEELIVFQEIPSVFGASRYDQKVTEAPSSVTIVTADDIKRLGARTLVDVLRRVNGFFVSYDRNYNYLGFRGFNRPGDFNSKVLLLVDGHRLNDNIYDQAGLGTESLVDVDLVDRIEIIRGPSSSLYGTNAFFGVINVITKRGRDVQGVEVSGEAASFGSYRGRGTYGSKFASGVEVLLSGSYFESDGDDRLYFPEFDDPATNFGVAEDADDDRFPSGLLKFSYQGMTLQAGYVSREKGIPTASYGTAFNTDETRSTDERTYVDLGFRRHLDDDTELTARLYYDHFYYQGDYLYDVPSLVLNQDRSTSEWWGAEVKVDRLFLENHKVTGGLEFSDSFRQDLENSDEFPAASYLDVGESSQNWAVFLQDEFTIRDGLLLNAGVRYDEYDSFGGTVNPRLALIFNTEKTTYKALYGQAFRAPNAYERFYIGTGFKASGDLDPETIRTYELVAERNLGGRLRASAAAYYYRIHKLISQETDPSDGLLVFQNRDDIGARGLEVELDLEGQWPLGLDGRLSYAIQQTEDLELNRRLTNSPQHIAQLNLILPLVPRRFFMGVDFNYVSSRHTLAGNTVGGYTTTNLTLFSHHIVKGLEISGSIYNLFDREYEEPGSGEHVQDQLEQDGRTFWLKLKYGF